MQVRFKFSSEKMQITNFIPIIVVSAICKYGALNGLSTETYKTLHKFYVKNPYRLTNKKSNVTTSKCC